MEQPLAAPRTLLFSDCIGIFQGGGCRAAAYAGAFRATSERGVHFSELAGASAGAITAALIAAGATPEWLDRELESLDFAGLLDAPNGGHGIRLPLPARARRLSNLLTRNGFYSAAGIERWVEEKLRDLLPRATRPTVLFKDLRLPLSVIAADLHTGRSKIWNTYSTPDESVARAVRGSCSIPFLFQPTGSYVDGGLVSNLPLHAIEQDSSDRRPVLAFALEDDSQNETPNDVLGLAAAIANTAVHGAQEIQEQMHPNVEVIRINTGSIRATDFAIMTVDKVKSLSDSGCAETQVFFDREGIHARPEAPLTKTTHEAETLDLLTAELLMAQHTIAIAQPDTKWVFELYTALFLARRRGVKIDVVLPEYNGNAEMYRYQREILKALGCRVFNTPADDPLDLRVFVVDAKEDRRAAIVYSSQGTVHATALRGRSGDEAVLALLADAVDRSVVDSEAAGPAPRGIEVATEAAVVDVLRRVDQYAAPVRLAVREIDLDAVDSWARYAHSYKQRQQREIARFLREAGAETFAGFHVLYGDGRSSLALPPIVEAGHDGRFTVVNGLSRLLLLHREGRPRAICAVASDVQAPPPARGVRPLSEVAVIVGKRNQPDHRYRDFTQGNVRAVERVAHTLASLTNGPRREHR